MKARHMIVYGMFEGENCLYVGHTSTPDYRREQQLRRFPGSEFRILQTCGARGLEVERKLIAEYRQKGQAAHNVASTTFNPDYKKNRRTVTLRIDKTQHLRLKKHVKPLGLKLEFWLQKAIDEQMQIQSASK